MPQVRESAAWKVVDRSAIAVIDWLHESYPSCDLTLAREESNRMIVCKTKGKHRCGVHYLQEQA
jgi:hypothetical protein